MHQSQRMRSRPPVLLAAAVLLLAAACADDAPDAGAGDSGAAASSLFDTRYCEVILVNVEAGQATLSVYNTVGFNLCPEALWSALDAAKIKAEHKVFAVILNGPRRWTVDRAKGGSSVTGEVVDFGGLKMRKAAELKFPLADLLKLQTSGQSYAQVTVLRDNSWIFNSGRQVYELADPKGAVYIMQSYSLQVDSKLACKDLPSLAARLKLPKGWSFGARTLTAQFTLTATGKATVVQDDLKNTYQLR